MSLSSKPPIAVKCSQRFLRAASSSCVGLSVIWIAMLPESRVRKLGASAARGWPDHPQGAYERSPPGGIVRGEVTTVHQPRSEYAHPPDDVPSHPAPHTHGAAAAAPSTPSGGSRPLTPDPQDPG